MLITLGYFIIHVTTLIVLPQCTILIKVTLTVKCRRRYLSSETSKQITLHKQRPTGLDSSRLLKLFPELVSKHCMKQGPCPGYTEITVYPARVEYKDYQQRISSYRHPWFTSGSLQVITLAQDGFYFDYTDQGGILTCFSCQVSKTLLQMEARQGNIHHPDCKFRPPSSRQPQDSEDETVGPIHLSSGYNYQELFNGLNNVPFNPNAAVIDRRRSNRHRETFGDVNRRPITDTFCVTSSIELLENRHTIDENEMSARISRCRDVEEVTDASRDRTPTETNGEEVIPPCSADETGLSEATGGCEPSDQGNGLH